MQVPAGFAASGARWTSPKSRGCPAVKPALWSAVLGAGQAFPNSGKFPARHRLLCRRLHVDASSCCCGAIAVFLEQGPRLGACSGQVVYPTVGPALRLPPSRERACIPIWEICRTTHAAFSRNCPWALRTAALWANDGFSETGCAGLWLRPSLSNCQAGLGVFPSRRGVHFRSLRSTNATYTTFPGTPPRAPSCRTGSRRACAHQPYGIHFRLCGQLPDLRGQRNRIFLSPIIYPPALTTR